MGQATSRDKISITETQWERLSDELIVHIISFLDLKQIAFVIPAVNRRFKKLSEDDKLWKQLYLKHFKNVYVDDQTSQFKKLFMLEVLDGRKNYQNQTKRGDCCDGRTSSAIVPGGVKMTNRDKSQRELLRQGAKLVILGESSTGKTSILLRLVRGLFLPYHEATIGASYLTKQLIVNNNPVRFEIWDTAGSERYHSLAPMYYRGAVAAILVYDITNEESYDKALRWVNELETTVTQKPIIVLVGNKGDLDKQRQIPKGRAEAYCKENNFLHYECSAKSGEGVVEIFIGIANQLINKTTEERDKKL